jgi:hypothetical protein
MRGGRGVRYRGVGMRGRCVRVGGGSVGVRREGGGGGGVGSGGLRVAGWLSVVGWLFCCVVFGELDGCVVVCWEAQ